MMKITMKVDKAVASADVKVVAEGSTIWCPGVADLARMERRSASTDFGICDWRSDFLASDTLLATGLQLAFDTLLCIVRWIAYY